MLDTCLPNSSYFLSPSVLLLLHNPSSPSLIISSKCVWAMRHPGFLPLKSDAAHSKAKFILHPGYYTEDFFGCFLLFLNWPHWNIHWSQISLTYYTVLCPYVLYIDQIRVFLGILHLFQVVSYFFMACWD